MSSDGFMLALNEFGTFKKMFCKKFWSFTNMPFCTHSLLIASERNAHMG
jgi:hypothetical protein